MQPHRPLFAVAKSIRDAGTVVCEGCRMAKLDATEIQTALGNLPEWKQVGDTITRTYVFKDFPEAVGFVGRIAPLAEEAWHHPDLDIRWNKVTVVLTTHDEGGLTRKDFELAARFDQA
jgi:4a-hydroxytetrahydrobiopterin dehydratase